MVASLCGGSSTSVNDVTNGNLNAIYYNGLTYRERGLIEGGELNNE